MILKLKKSLPNFFKFQSMFIRCNRRQEIVSKLNYCLNKQNWTIVLPFQRDSKKCPRPFKANRF